ncbi:MAG: dihydroorotase [Candidatus Omnitrophica bacterium]|nr:dihydroorotase [Candidatus Omnitrophota bacterium]
MRILIKGGRVIDPANSLDGVLDILVDSGVVAKVAKNIRPNGFQVIDAADQIVIPGLVDMHVHLREPGREDKETITSGTMAALKGGVTSMAAMPNTCPCIDSPEQVVLLRKIIAQSASANVYITAAITKGRSGLALTDIEGLKEQGVIALSDDGSSVDSEELMRAALQRSKKAGIVVICHCEDKTLSRNGSVNLGIVSTRLGLKGISKESEYLRVARDIDLAQEIDAPIHITHVSCQESVTRIAEAKKKGIKVTADTAPHYFTLSQEALQGFDTNMKMNPPLRTKSDVAAIRQGLRDGTIDTIASDHAPHTENEKEIEFERAEFGVIGLETELAVGITELVHTGILGWQELVAKLTCNPARILGIAKGTLSVGADADIAVVSPDKEWVVEKHGFLSRSKNSCFLNRTLKGYVVCTICGGKIAYRH